jgi:nitronate monooxygenase
MTLPGAAGVNASPTTRLFGLRYPIISAPMGMIAGGRLAAAVSNAGGLGLIGPGYEDAAWIEREFALATASRVGVGFITWDLAANPGRLDVALEFKPAAVMLSFGDPTPFLPAIRRSGARLFLQVQSVADALAAARHEPDLIVAQGTEAGGHGGARALLPLLPAVVDCVAPIPVAAAGGICDGRGIVASLALGASAVLMGTLFYAAEESLARSAAKAQVVDRGGDETLRTRVFDIVRGLPWPQRFTGRVLRNAFTDRWHGREGALSLAVDNEQSRYAAAAAAGDFDTAAVWAGEGVDLIDQIEPAHRIIERVMRQAADTLTRMKVASVPEADAG